MRRVLLLLAAVLLALIAAMAAKALLVEPPALRSHSPAGEFDAGRAKARLDFVLGDQRPHPTDTESNDRVRSRIVGLLTQMELKPVVREQLACNELYKARGVSCARVRNIIAVLGPREGKAVLLNAHYDSSPVGPGAGDDGIGVATLLEIGWLLKDKPLKRPVILLFNEGEELGLIGARAFLADPLSRNVDSLVNLEARGVRGPVNMFEASRPNGPAIALFAQAVKRPVANSLSTDVYRLMPNYTDVNSFAERGWLTLNLAPIGNETRYHSPGDDLAALDLRTLQHMGDQTLALTQALSQGVAKGSGQQIFMDIAGRGLIHLPLTVGVVLLASLLVVFALIGWRRRRLMRGVAVTLATLLGSSALAWLALAAIGAVRSGMFWRAFPIWTHLATYASVALVAVAAIALLGQRSDRTQLRPAFCLVFLILGAGIGVAAPGGIVFFLFPPLIVLVGIAAGRFWQPAERAGSALAILFLYLTWGAMLALLEELLNAGPMWLFAPLGALLILPMLIEARPLIQAAGPRAASAVAGALALAGWAVSALAPAYSADRQQRFTIEHATDPRSGRASWSIVNDGATLPPEYPRMAKWKYGKFPHSERRRWIAMAPAAAGIAPPSVEPISSLESPRGRTITVRLRTDGALGVLLVAPDGADIRSAGTAGFIRPIDRTTKKQKYQVSCFGRSCDGLVLTIVTGSRQRVKLALVGSRPVLPPIAKPLTNARPRFARPQYLPDQTLTISPVWL
jgi:hypothetical protein